RVRTSGSSLLLVSSGGGQSGAGGQGGGNSPPHLVHVSRGVPSQVRLGRPVGVHARVESRQHLGVGRFLRGEVGTRPPCSQVEADAPVHARGARHIARGAGHIQQVSGPSPLGFCECGGGEVVGGHRFPSSTG